MDAPKTYIVTDDTAGPPRMDPSFKICLPEYVHILYDIENDMHIATS